MNTPIARAIARGFKGRGIDVAAQVILGTDHSEANAIWYQSGNGNHRVDHALVAVFFGVEEEGFGSEV